MKKLILLVIPGIGTKEKGFSKSLESDLRAFTNQEVSRHLEIIETRPFSVTDVDKNQKDLLDRLSVANKLGGILSMRQFVIEAFGDGVTFERDAQSPNSNYKRIHHYIKNEIEKVNESKEEGDVFVILAASMGAHILSTYIWDADHKKGIFENETPTDQQRLKNLDYLVTIGCNIPLFVSGLAEDQIIAIDKRNENFKWDNYYDRDDVLGWPLKQLSPSYGELVTDYEINSGLYIGSHTRYWDDNDFTKPFSRSLNECWKNKSSNGHTPNNELEV